MAGTRFLIQLSFLLQFIVLTLLTLHTCWYYNDASNQGIFPIRNGMSNLQMMSDIVNSSTLHAKQPTFEVYIPPGIDKQNIDSEMDQLLHSKFSSNRPTVKTYEYAFDNDTIATTCGITNDHDLLLLLEEKQFFASEMDVTKIIVLQCKLNKEQPIIINVHETGGILVRTYTQEKDAISRLNDLFQTPTIATQTTEHTKIKIFLTVIDEDPISYNATHPHYHHNNVGVIVSNSIQRYLQPFLNKLFPIINITIIPKTSIILPDDIIINKSINQESIESLFHNKAYMQSNYLDSVTPSDYIMNYIVLIPSLDHTPLYVNDDKEIVRYRNGNLFSTCNIPSTCNQDDCTVSTLLQKQFQKIMLVFISQIRSQLLGLSRKIVSNDTSYIISYLPIKDGVASYEINSLVRSMIPLKYEYVIENLQLLNNLFHKRTNIPVDLEISTMIQNVMHTLHTLESSNSYSTIQQLNHVINTLINMKHNPTILELNHFPRDYWLATFAPLLFPLLVPLFIGLIREWKRLQKKKKEKVE